MTLLWRARRLMRTSCPMRDDPRRVHLIYLYLEQVLQLLYGFPAQLSPRRQIGKVQAVLPKGVDLSAGQHLQLCNGQIEVECRANWISGSIVAMKPCQHETRVAGSSSAKDELTVTFISVNSAVSFFFFKQKTAYEITV